MRGMGGKISTAAMLIASLLAGSPAAAQTADDQRALVVEYLTQRENSWQARLHARSWRQETTRMEGTEEVRTLVEVACPDGYHLHVIRGKTVTDFYSVDGMEYRQRDGKWVTTPAPRGHNHGCYDPREVGQFREMGSPEERAQRFADDFASGQRVEKGAIRTVRGERCQEWRVSSNRPSERASYESNTQCLSLADGHLVESNMTTGMGSKPIVTITYDWNKPMVIRAPANH
jgi:hypothetical protein